MKISTYFAGTSWDYNLVTTYPLLVVLFTRAMGGGGAIAGVLLVVGLVGIVGHRAVFAGNAALLRLHVALQWAFLLGTGVAAPWIAARAGDAADEAPAAPGAPASAA